MVQYHFRDDINRLSNLFLFYNQWWGESDDVTVCRFSQQTLVTEFHTYIHSVQLYMRIIIIMEVIS